MKKLMKIYANDAEGIESADVVAVLFALNRSSWNRYAPDSVPGNTNIRVRAEGGDILIYVVPHES